MTNEQTVDLINVDFSAKPGVLSGVAIEDLLAEGMTYDFVPSVIVRPGVGHAIVEIWRNDLDLFAGRVRYQGTRVTVEIDPWSSPTADALNAWCLAVQEQLDYLTGYSNWRVRVRAGVLLEAKTKAR